MSKKAKKFKAKESKLTPWFSAHEFPSRPGYYQREYESGRHTEEAPDYWDGQCWILCDFFGNFLHESSVWRRWRGYTTRQE